MTSWLRYFSGCFCLMSLIACNQVFTKLLFKGENVEGKHSRALFDTESGFVVGGVDGAYSVFSNDFKQKTNSIKGAEDLRDVHILGDGSMIFINSGEQGRIWKVSSSSELQELTYDQKEVFINGVDFWDDTKGVAYADPIDGKFLILITIDGGEIWHPLDHSMIPISLVNEAGFAASGTGISALGDSTIYIGTGMADTARLFCSYDMGGTWSVKPTPIKAGDSYGIYSLYFWSQDEGVVVGGSYLNPSDTENLCFSTLDRGDSWMDAGTGLGGYTSCIHGNHDGSFLVATGSVATYYSLDKGQTWRLLLDETYFSVRVNENRIYLSGKEGVVAVYLYKI